MTSSESRTTAPLSFAQQRLWFLDQFEPGSALYNIPLVIDLEGPLDIGVLERSLTALVERHPALRTVFPVVDGQPRQHVPPLRPMELEVERLPAPADADALAARIAELVEAPFELATGPLLRVRLLRLEEDHHVMVGAMHHIVSDKWSAGIFMRELTALYESGLEGRDPGLPELPTTYVDHAIHEREWLQGDVMERELGYWRERLAPPRPELDLPTDHPRPAVASYRGARTRGAVPTEDIEALEQWCRGQKATLYMGLLGVFGALLHRYTEQDDLIVGTPFANRTRHETEGLIGFFVNTLPLRLDLSGNPTFGDLVARVKTVLLGAAQHQSLPFEKIVEELNPERALSRSPIFQTVLNFHNVPGRASEARMAGPLRLRRRIVDTPTAKFDLTLTLRRTDDGLDTTAEYARDLFEAETVQRVLRHFAQLLTGLTRNPDRPVAEAPLLTAEERTSVLAWGRAPVDSTPSIPVHTLVAEQAGRTPSAPAVRFEDQVVTYDELRRATTALARRLEAIGAGPGARVGICLDRGIPMVTTVLAVLRTGAAFVPLDPEFPPDRLEYMAHDADLAAVVTQSSLRDRLGPVGAPRICLDADVAEDGRGDEEPPSPPPTPSSTPGEGPEAIAYLMYTSGSTGRPKGVAIPHGALSNFLGAMTKRPGIEATDVVAAVTTLSFDISLLELLLPLTVGATVVVMSRETVTDGERLAGALTRRDITFVQATPATFQMLREVGWAGDPRLKVLCGGEALPGDLAAWLGERVGSVWNMYGPTETTIWSTVDRVEPGRAVTIGRAIDATELYVLDRQQQLVPVGAAGELYIGGAGLACEYWRREELTADRFVPHPFSDRADARLYRTGDRVRWRADGRLDHLGRTDAQVKVRGFRIELGEIESVLADHPAVRQGVVVVREDAPGDRRLVAYVVAAGPRRPTPSALRAFLNTRLPVYMLPSACVLLDELPLTPNGKVDRRALPAPRPAEPVGTRVRPRTPVEARVAEVWCDVLGLPEVGVDDDFFTLGGHSLLATQVVARLRRELEGALSVRALFETPTVEGLATRMRLPSDPSA